MEMMLRLFVLLLSVGLGISQQIVLPQGTGCETPVSSLDVVPKSYVDSLTSAYESRIADLEAKVAKIELKIYPTCHNGTVAEYPVASCEAAAACFPMWFGYEMPSKHLYMAASDGGSHLGYCELHEGAYWLMVVNYWHKGNVNIASNFRGDSFPQFTSRSMGHDGNTTPDEVGQTTLAFMNKFEYSSVRFRCLDSSGNMMHFQTSSVGPFQSGTNNYAALKLDYTYYSDNTKSLPSTATTFPANLGDYGLTSYPFYKSGYVYAIGPTSGGVHSYRCATGSASANHHHAQVFIRA
eukprot:TRINITY_DN36039_c0_g1_i1.p1 TRINITY_DN36039_c0_g1~~TRINITY_DN36039_c0_g1_i1.p1  ORF type:complete len:294 (-),score=31.72 TRINITY_DN36039_c0_g1_i1:19-900(-)